MERLESRILLAVSFEFNYLPGDLVGFSAAVNAYLDDPAAAARAGAAGRAYAEEHFDLDRVADRFETVIKTACQEKAGAS